MANKNRVEARLDPALLALKKKEETTSEFVERAVKSLRDNEDLKKTIRELKTVSFTNVAPMEHGIIIKMCRAFIKARVKAPFTTEESTYLRKVIQEEVK